MLTIISLLLIPLSENGIKGIIRKLWHEGMFKAQGTRAFKFPRAIIDNYAHVDSFRSAKVATHWYFLMVVLHLRPKRRRHLNITLAVMRIKCLYQEPLGVASDVVHPNDLPRWSEIAPAHYLTDYSASGAPKHNNSPFPYDPEINHKIILWSGDISALQVDAIVNSTNESMNESNPVSDRIFQRAGSELKEEINLDIRGQEMYELRKVMHCQLDILYTPLDPSIT
ncbi:hypothetical protein GEV33_009527 [Tenebrio molitor]|uniref:Macro domain-containing protein n=1 Tax=Tenebrio molitor TaxID=7067 RepID=A0A8J6L830_TENMO|nr:hypothetical protein GEV33_009527 [Tenebrio molitor]